MLYMIYLTAVGLTPSGSSTLHIYTQAIHRITQSTQTIHRTTQMRVVDIFIHIYAMEEVQNVFNINKQR
jgi:uncharacterized integral membrane protein